jgi:hypothetical protein
MSQDRTLYLVANGDLRPCANRMCWPAQKRVENAFAQVWNFAARTASQADDSSHCRLD